MGTKHIAIALFDQYLEQLSLEVARGRAAIAQQLHRLAEGDRQSTCATNGCTTILTKTIVPPAEKSIHGRDLDVKEHGRDVTGPREGPSSPFTKSPAALIAKRD